MKIKSHVTVLLSVILSALILCSCNTIPVNDGNVQIENGEASEPLNGEKTQVPNPLIEYPDADFTEEAGFSINYYPSIDGKLTVDKIYLIDKSLASLEMNYNENSDVTFRIAKQFDGNISGVYDAFEKTSTETVGGIADVSLKYSADSALAEWSYDDYMYSLYAGKCSPEEFKTLLTSLILYTDVSDTKASVLGFTNSAYGDSQNIPTENKELSYYGGVFAEKDEYGEFQSVIATKKGTVMTVLHVTFDENGEMAYTPLDSVTADTDFFCLRINAFIPEGMPNLAVKLESDGMQAIRLISYDGRGERPTMSICAE